MQPRTTYFAEVLVAQRLNRYTVDVWPHLLQQQIWNIFVINDHFFSSDKYIPGFCTTSLSPGQFSCVCDDSVTPCSGSSGVVWNLLGSCKSKRCY